MLLLVQERTASDCADVTKPTPGSGWWCQCSRLELLIVLIIVAAIVALCNAYSMQWMVAFQKAVRTSKSNTPL